MPGLGFSWHTHTQLEDAAHPHRPPPCDSKYDTNHLVSGVRFAVNSPEIVAVAGKWCDVIDQHDYSDLPNTAWLQQIHAITGRPVVLGEFSFTAADSNMPNTVGARAYNPAPTQTDRTRMVRGKPHPACESVTATPWAHTVPAPAPVSLVPCSPPPCSTLRLRRS